MDHHLSVLNKSCRVCGRELKQHSYTCLKYSTAIQIIWKQNVLLDSSDVHPEKICGGCRSVCTNEGYTKKGLKSSVTCVNWTVHTVDCVVCCTYPIKTPRGRKRKRAKGTNIGEDKEIEEERDTDSANEDEERTRRAEDVHVRCYTILMSNIPESIAKIPSEDKLHILEELLTSNLSELVRICSSLPSAEKETLLNEVAASQTKLHVLDPNNCEPLVSRIESSELVNLTTSIFKSQINNIKRDAHSFNQTYKNINVLKELDRSSWFDRRNPLLKAAVEALSSSSTSDFNKCLVMEHLYSVAVTESVVMPFSFLINLLLFTFTNSKLAINVLGKILPGGSYTTLTNWRDGLASVSPCFPDGDCVLAFDNDQIVQKQWKVKAGGNARVSILTSICQAEVGSSGLQKREDLAPRKWQSKLLQPDEPTKKCLKDAVTSTDEAQSILRKENKRVIQECLEKVVSEQEKNDKGEYYDAIDSKILEKEKSKTTRTCPCCFTEMPKQKRVCSNETCKVNLKAYENKMSGEDTLGTALLKSRQNVNHRFTEKESVAKVTDNMMIMDTKTTFQDLKVEWEHVETGHMEAVRITVSDPVFVNPSSYEAVIEVLRAVGKTAKITRYGFSGEGARQWLSVTMDGSPYLLAYNIIDKTYICSTCANDAVAPVTTAFFANEWEKHKKVVHKDSKDTVGIREFNWVVLRIGPLHVEMTMAKTFFSVNWDVMLKDLAKELGFTSESALKYARSASNHHHAMSILQICHKGGWSELLLPYVRQQLKDGKPMSVNDFLNWMDKAEDPNCIYLFDQLWTYLGAINIYHMGVRRNNWRYVDAGLIIFSPMFSVHPYTSKYQLIELRDRCERAMYPDDLQAFIRRTESITTSCNKSKGEGLDAQLEEVNKASKAWSVGAMSALEWLRIFRNYDQLLQLRENVLNWLKVKDPKEEADLTRTRDSLCNEISQWRRKIRTERYVSTPFVTRPHFSLDSKVKLDEGLLKLTATGDANRKSVFEGVYLEGKQRYELDLQDVYITEEEKLRKTDIKNMTKAKIMIVVKEKLDLMCTSSDKTVLLQKYEKIKKKIDSTLKSVLLALHDEVESAISLAINSNPD